MKIAKSLSDIEKNQLKLFSEDDKEVEHDS